MNYNKKEALRKAKVNIKNNMERDIDFMQQALKNIEQTETFEDFMESKKKLLETIVLSLPLSDDECPFCNLILGDVDSHIRLLTNCAECEYGKIHGVCYNKISDYQNLLTTIKTLLHKLNNYWDLESWVQRPKKEDKVWQR